MKVLVSFVAFHPDNYQGASGKSFPHKLLVEIPDDLKISEVSNYIYETVWKAAKQGTCYSDLPDFRISIQTLELFVAQ